MLAGCGGVARTQQALAPSKLQFGKMGGARGSLLVTLRRLGQLPARFRQHRFFEFFVAGLAVSGRQTRLEHGSERRRIFEVDCHCVENDFGARVAARLQNVLEISPKISIHHFLAAIDCRQLVLQEHFHATPGGAAGRAIGQLAS